MNSSYINAAVGAFLAVAFIVMTVSIASDAIFHSGHPEAEGYAIEAREGSATASADSADEGITPIGPLLAGASVEGGQRAFRKCQACHTVEDGGANRVGPNLWNIVDGPVAAADGFGYSTAMTDYAEGGEKTWDYEALNNFLHAPRRYMRGTAMGFAGLKKDDERADVIAYLRSLATTPAPLPSTDAAPAEEAEAEPASAETTEEPAAADAAPADDAEAEPAAEATEEPAKEEMATDGEDKPAEATTE